MNRIFSKISLFLFLSFTFVKVDVAFGGRGGANADQPKVEAVLAEIRQLMRDHYKIQPSKRAMAASAEEREEADSLDDIRYTVQQAKDVLAGMKKRWGYHEPAIKEDKVIPGEQFRWSFPIKYAFNGTEHTKEQQDLIRMAIKLWMDNTCVTFEEYASEDEEGIEFEPHILFINSTGCWSYIGKAYRYGQSLSIGPGCDILAKIAHEVGHALGLNHEQSRPDRDEYISIAWENIIPGKEHNFEIRDDWDPGNTQYDYSTVMHYDSLGFSKNYALKERVLVPFDVYQMTAIGQRARLQFNDIKRINFAYDCMKKNCDPSLLQHPCENGGYQDPKSCRICRCPPGTFGDDCQAVEPAKGDGMAGCGGEVFLEPCQLRTLALPTYPEPYGEDSSCTWRIRTSAKGLAFAFQSQPDMPCSKADTCYDFVEIRTNMNSLDTAGRFFCQCGENKGRVAIVDAGGDETTAAEALVRFASTTRLEKSGAGKSAGFLLNVYATCNGTLASELPNSCTITTTGYESCSGVSMPLCDATIVDVIEPVPEDEPTTTSAPTTRLRRRRKNVA